MRILQATIIWLLLTSCATVFSRKSYNLNVGSTTPGDKVEINNQTYSLPAEVLVTRAKTDLSLKLTSDTTITDYKIQSSLSPTFVYWNLLYPFGYLIDLTNQKRFHYGNTILFERDDSTKAITPRISNSHRFRANLTHKGQINLSLALPHINSFYLKPEGETAKSNSGFWGFSAGLEYYHKDNRYVRLTSNAVTDFFVPIPAAVDRSGEYESMSSIYFSLTNNHQVNCFHFGYGINYSINSWELNYNDPSEPIKEPIIKISKSFGLTFTGYYQLTKTFLVGVIYRPTLLIISPKTEFNYEHLISLEFGWRIPLKK
jgi:hypothetical protein